MCVWVGIHDMPPSLWTSCAVSNAKKVSLELGGKSPLIIFGDCDLDKAVRQASAVVLPWYPAAHVTFSVTMVPCSSCDMFLLTGASGCVLQQRGELHCSW